jgi:hypothetical protein
MDGMRLASKVGAASEIWRECIKPLNSWHAAVLDQFACMHVAHHMC